MVIAVIIGIVTVSCSQGGDVKINIIETTDVHGVIFPFDFVENKPLDASLASLSTMVKRAED